MDFLDYSFIYNPSSFLDISGSCWRIFRKNINFAMRLGDYEYRLLDKDDSELIEDLFIGWLTEKGFEFIEDDGVMSDYLFNGFCRKGLFLDNRMGSVNVWDENYRYINFRYCVSSSLRGVNELSRYLFYTDPYVLGVCKLVNDGGCLGKSSLKAFKERLNPLEVIKVHSFNFKKG